MTANQLQSIFHVDNINSVPNYELIKLYHHHHNEDDHQFNNNKEKRQTTPLPLLLLKMFLRSARRRLKLYAPQDKVIFHFPQS